VDFDPVQQKEDNPQIWTEQRLIYSLMSLKIPSLGLIPKGWNVGKIETECKLIMGQSPKSILEAIR
jgi:hypothetical protein